MKFNFQFNGTIVLSPAGGSPVVSLYVRTHISLPGSSLCEGKGNSKTRVFNVIVRETILTSTAGFLDSYILAVEETVLYNFLFKEYIMFSKKMYHSFNILPFKCHCY